jgi:cobalt/nickel transport system permease protein/cobalt/nickel transport protein
MTSLKRGLFASVFLLLLFSPVLAEEEAPKWPGVDETVVGKYARELGREARDPYINTDQGDLLLFLFALAGTAGGFIMGYYWHKVFVAGKKDLEPRD